MALSKKTFPKAGAAAAAGLDPFQNFETVTYTGNGGTQKITGYIRKGAGFNGSSSEIDIPHNTQFDATGGLSISLWINKAVLDSSNDRIMDKANGGSGSYGWEMMYNSTNGYRLDVYDTSNSVSSARSGSSGISATGIWDHVVGTISSSGVAKIYVNGVLKDTTSALGGTISSNTGSVTIGRYFNASGGCNAKFDQIRFFNTDIDQTAVDALYAEVYGDSTVSTTDFGGYGGFALYQLDENANDTGGTYNGTATNVNFLGMAFQPDLVWIKDRAAAENHYLIDSVRGLNGGSVFETLYTNLINGQANDIAVTSLDSNGFTLGSGANGNVNGESNVAWCWKAGGAAVSGTGTSGITNVEVSANTAAGFSIVKYNGGGTAGGTVTHGLDSAPELIIVKRTDTSGDWIVGCDYLTSWGHILQLNLSDAEASYAGFNSTSPSSSVFTLGSNNPVNNSSGSYIALCFHSVDGYQKIGSYSGSGATGNAITTGFQPRFVMIKRYDSGTSESWLIYDSLRVSGSNESMLYPNLSNIEASYSDYIDFNSDGFTMKDGGGSRNAASGTYIYLAIA